MLFLTILFLGDELMRILVIGEMVTDIIVNPVPNIDFTVDCIPVNEILMRNGGDAMNIAINLTRLGNKVTFIGKVGKDIFGRFLIDVARDESLDTRYIRYSDKIPSAKVIALVKENGERSFLYYSGANAYLSLDDIDFSLLDDCDYLHIGGVFHLPSIDGEGEAVLLKEAKNKNLVTSMDVAWDQTNQWDKIIAPCYPYLDYFLPNINEAKHITHTENVKEMAVYFKNKGIKTVVIKLGKEGCYCSGENKSFFCGIYDVPVVDTTGSGDSFVSGFLTGLKNEKTLETCAIWGTATAAFSVQQAGATTGIPDFEQLMDFINNTNNLEIRYE